MIERCAPASARTRRSPLAAAAAVYIIASTARRQDDLVAIMNRAACAGLPGVAVRRGRVRNGPQSDAQQQTDRETAARVQSALDADKQLYAKHIIVRADNGVVRLTGFVWDPAGSPRGEDAWPSWSRASRAS